MICKGTTHNNGVRLAKYMTTGKPGERAELWQLRGYEATNIRDAFRDVQIMAKAGKCQQPFFHVQMRNREGEELTRQQWEHAADRIEKMLGLAGQPRAIAFHTFENGDAHMHLAWSRIREDTLTAIPLPFFKQRLKKLSRELELEFGLEPVTDRRKDNIQFAPTRAEQEQARRLGVDIHEIRNTIRHCYERSDCGASFQAALEHEGLTVARGEKRDFIVVDHAGGIHALGKRILDVSAAKIRDRFSDLDRESLPTVEMARAAIGGHELEAPEKRDRATQLWDRDRADGEWVDRVISASIVKDRSERQSEETKQRKAEKKRQSTNEKHWPINPPTHQGWPGFDRAAEETTIDARTENLKGAPAHIWTAWLQSDDARAFAAALDDRGIMFARVTKEEAERLHREAAYAKEIGRYARRFSEGEIVIVTEPRLEFRRDGERVAPSRFERIDPALAGKFLKNLDDRAPLQGIDATLEASDKRAQQRAVDREMVRLDRATNIKDFSRGFVNDKINRTKKPGRGAGRAIGKTLDVIGGAVESLFAPIASPEQRREGEITQRRSELEAERASELARYAEQATHQREEAERRQNRERDGGGRER